MHALGQLVERHQQSVRAVALRMTGRWDVADDLAQEVFLRVYRFAGRYKPAAAFRTWLYRIVVNLCLDRAKSPRLSELPEEIGDASCEMAEQLARAERSEAIQRAIAQLPERQRMALVLHRFEHMTHAQIAQATGWSESAVESLLVRAYDQLRQRLSQWSPG